MQLVDSVSDLIVVLLHTGQRPEKGNKPSEAAVVGGIVAAVVAAAVAAIVVAVVIRRRSEICILFTNHAIGEGVEE